MEVGSEASSFAFRRDKYIKIGPVLAKYYPGFQLGRSRDEIKTAMLALKDLGIQLHPDTLGELRDGSKRKGKHLAPQIGELLLLNALSRNETWTTPSAAAIMIRITGAGISSHEYGEHIRMSGGLTPAIAELIGINRHEIITRLLRGMRIDGAIIATENPKAWNILKEVSQHYVRDHESLPPSRQKNMDMLVDMDGAHTPQQLYAALYKKEENIPCGRRVATFVPYELDYWKWLIDKEIIASYKHLPFTRIVLDTFAHGFSTTNKQIGEIVPKKTGVPVDNNIIQLRMQMIRHDIPPGFT